MSIAVPTEVRCPTCRRPRVVKAFGPSHAASLAARECRVCWAASQRSQSGVCRTRVGGPHPPPAPTSARPGTPEKVAVIEARAAAGHQLFHPDDAGPVPD